MGMSQEEIEALMAGGNFGPQDDEQDSEQNDELDDLLNEVIGDTPEEEKKAEDAPVDDELTSPQDNTKNEDKSTDDNDNIDDILAGIDGIVDEPESNDSEDDMSENVERQIDEGVYPLPVTKEHKVVSQLNQVAEDSEKKASQIFDVLSFILDENNLIQEKSTSIKKFVENQIELLEKLSQKFPNIDIFKTNLEDAKTQISSLSDIDNYINEENSKVFEAMELMQFHDINRQKIERVMAVIKKLNDYLNGLFEDDDSKPEIKIAKHISGDSNDTVSEEDLDALINQFSESK